MISGFLKNMVRRIKDLFNMLNDDSYIIGHHGTSEEAARSILAGQFRLSLSGRYGHGIYFWCEENCSKCMAHIWANVYHQPAPVILESKIDTTDSVNLDLQVHMQQMARYSKKVQATIGTHAHSTEVVRLYFNSLKKRFNADILVFFGPAQLPEDISQYKECPTCCKLEGKSAIVRDVGRIITTKRGA